jgi:predicted DNA-binding mobile mystery protein A
VETRNRGRNALDSKLLPLRRLKARVVTPRGGWIVAIRQALGMTTTQMAQRLGVSQSNIVQMEMAESEGRIKLETLKRAAEALNCTLLYAPLHLLAHAGSRNSGLITEPRKFKASAEVC